MKLTKVLIPEIAKGTRYSGDEAVDKMIRLYTDSFLETENGFKLIPQSKLVGQDLVSPECGPIYYQVKKALVEKWPIYHICHDFGEALMNLKERDIQDQYLPEEFKGYISLPTDLIPGISGAYVYIEIADKFTPFQPENYGRKVFWISYFGDLESKGTMWIGRLNWFKEDGKKVSEVIEHYEGNLTSEGAHERYLLGNLLLNAILYLNSQDPELLALKPSFNAPVSKQKSHTVKGHLNLCTVPVTAINWDYKKIARYEEAETWVDTFMRWQRCGEKFSQIKLTWVKEHSRKYKHRIEDETE